MLRFLHISGFIIFALLMGFSARRLVDQYVSGELFERYNNQRRADITLFTVGIAGLATMGYAGYVRIKAGLNRKSYQRPAVPEKQRMVKKESTSIYSLPVTLDKWEGRRIRTAKTRPGGRFELVRVWVGTVRVFAIALPASHVVLLGCHLSGLLPQIAHAEILIVIMNVYMLLGGLAAIGLLRTRTWGLSLGYAVAILHLLLFPVGTAAGLIFLVGLVGATPHFLEVDSDRKKAVLRARSKTHVAHAG